MYNSLECPEFESLCPNFDRGLSDYAGILMGRGVRMVSKYKVNISKKAYNQKRNFCKWLIPIGLSYATRVPEGGEFV